MSLLEDDDYWNTSQVSTVAKLDFFDDDDDTGFLTSELEPESGAELITLNVTGASRVPNSSSVPSTSSLTSQSQSQSERFSTTQPIASANLTNVQYSTPATAVTNVQSVSPNRAPVSSVGSTPSKKPQVRLTVPKSLAAEYTFKVRKAVATKSADQKALELERCERLLQQYVRSYIATSPLPKVTFSPDEVISKLTSNGKKVEEAVLEVFRSEKQKRTLLDRACASLNGYTITRVTLFLFRTLGESLFKDIVLAYPSAVNHLVSYYKSMGDYNNLEKIFKLMERGRELFYLLLKKANNEPVAETKLAALQTIRHRVSSSEVETRLRLLNVSQLELDLVTEQIQLLDCQIKLQHVEDAAVKKKTNQILASHPASPPVTRQSLLATVHHCEVYHPNATSSSPVAPEAINSSEFYKRGFKMTEMEYQWPLVRVFAQRRQWDKLEQLMAHKGFFSTAASSLMGGVGGGAAPFTNRPQCAIGFDNMAVILSDCQAPADVVAKYLMCIKDQHSRLQQAGVLDCKLAVVLTYIENKDRHSLELFASRLVTGSKESREAMKALEDRSIKWKK